MTKQGKRTVSQHTRADGQKQTANRVGGEFDNKHGAGELAAADAFSVDHNSTMEIGETRTAPSEHVESPIHDKHFDPYDVDFRVAQLMSEDDFAASFTRVDDKDGLSMFDYRMDGPGGSIEGTLGRHPLAVDRTPVVSDALRDLVEDAERQSVGDYTGMTYADQIAEQDKVAAANLRQLVGEDRYPIYETGGALAAHLAAKEAATPLPIGETRDLSKSFAWSEGDAFDHSHRASRLIGRDNLTGTVTHDGEGQYTATITGPAGTGTFTLLRPESDGVPNLNDAVTSLTQSANESRYWKAVRPEDQDEFELYAQQSSALQEAVGADRLDAYASPHTFEKTLNRRVRR